MIFFVGTALAIGLITIAAALIIIAIVITLVSLLFTWRIIYPWLVRIGRWSSQLRNIAFLFFLLIGVFAVWYALGQAGIQLPLLVLLIIAIPLGSVFILLLLLAIVVWLVRLWRYSWPPLRNVFWDIHFRVVALGWKMILGVPLGIIWFFYRPPLRWLVAVLLFYLRGLSAGVAWFLYNPPLRDLIRVGLFFARLIARFTAWILYNPPLRWLVDFGIFSLRLGARFVSGLIYAIWSWWPMAGVREVLRKGLTVESKSYQDYKRAHHDRSPAA
jgi:hypothetical protein